MTRFYSLASKIALTVLLINIFMLFVVDFASAEFVITVLSVLMMAVLFAVSTMMLKKQSREEQK